MEGINQIDRNSLSFLEDIAREQNIQYFNLRLAAGESTSLSIVNGISKISKIGNSQGFSIQTFINGGWGLAVGKDFTKKSFTNVFNQAAKLAKFSAKYADEKYNLPEMSYEDNKFLIEEIEPINEIGPDQKIKFLLNLDKQARINERIKSIRISYSDGSSKGISFNGSRFTEIKKAAVYMGIEVVAKEDNNQQRFFKSIGGLGGYETRKKAMNIGIEAAENALELLSSKMVKGGTYNIIMDPTLCGTFIHEAFGHACEADAVIAGESLLANMIGEKVGANNINIYDDATMIDQYGYTPFDNEGTKGQKTILVRNGILNNFLHNLETASKMGAKPTGNARASGYSSRPIVRMTNTYLGGGDSNLEEMIEEMKNGILCVGWNYGYTNPADGSFMFKMAKGYMIEEGKKTQIIRDAAISGMTLDVLNKIKLLSREILLDEGHCGKSGQTAAVGSGGPYTFIENMTIGGQ